MTIVGLDIGFGYTKSVSPPSYLDAFPSVVGEWSPQALRLGAGLDPRHTDGLVLDGHPPYLVGERALTVTHRRFTGLDREWVDSAAYLALALTALRRQVPQPGASLHVVTGLPVDDVERLAATVKRQLEGVHTVRVLPADVPWQVYVAQVSVVPQPLGTVFAQLLDERGAIRDHALLGERLGVLDVGFRTVDYFTLAGFDLIPAECLTRTTGMADVLLDLSRALAQRWGVELDPHELDEVLLRRTLRFGGEAVDLGPVIDPLLAQHAEAISAHGRMLWGDRARTLAALWLTGGGAQVLGRALNLGSHARLVESPQIQNALGYCRYGCRLWRGAPTARRPEPAEKDVR